MTDLYTKAQLQAQQKLPFVLFCKPDSQKIIGLFQKNNTSNFVESFEEKGFVFAPFDGDKIPFIPLDQSDVYIENDNESAFFVSSNGDFSENENDKVNFENLIKKGIGAIEEGLFKKVVLSRKENHLLSNFDFISVFRRMLSVYPSAFRYCFFHPNSGMWMGATPEQLVKIDEDLIETVALAGTQSFDGTEQVVWPEKEKLEQQFVTDFIASQLADFVFRLEVSSPSTVKAGALLHIKTDISGRLLIKDNLKELVSALHPTPAVCGLPKATAKAFILKNEGYDREFYSGFLGELNVNLATFQKAQTNLFVNLRCMKIENNNVALFVGCGITKDSTPDKEYIETVNKSLTMKKIL